MSEARSCKHGDPFCPCQDGDSCNHEPSIEMEKGQLITIRVALVLKRDVEESEVRAAIGGAMLSFQDGAIMCEFVQPDAGGEWRNVKVELPREYKAVIVAHENCGPQVYIATLVGTEWRQAWNVNMRFNTVRVTHWQPLPAPPESGREPKP